MPIEEYPEIALELLEVRLLDTVTGESFYYRPSSWGDLADALLAAAAHRGHNLEAWVALRDQVDPGADVNELPMDARGRVMAPWTRIAYTGRGQIWSMSGRELDVRLGAIELIELGDLDSEEDGFSLGAKTLNRVPLAKAKEIAYRVVESLHPRPWKILVVGSIRRNRPDVGDVEIVVRPRDLNVFIERLREQGFEISGKLRQASKVVDGVKVDLYLVHSPEEWGSMVFHYTGDALWNVAMRQKAIKKGWKLNQYGLFDRTTGKPVLQSQGERAFFKALDVRYHEPEERSLKARKPAGKMAGPGEAEPWLDDLSE